MDRLTQEIEGKIEMLCRFEDCMTEEEICPECNKDECLCLQSILNKLKQYEDMEEQLEQVYGECDGLLEEVIKNINKYGRESDLEGKPQKARLLTDEDVDKWQEYKQLEEQGLLLKLKLKVGDTFWELNDNFVEPAIYPRKALSLQHVLYCMDRLGKVTFLTKEEAEAKLEEGKK